MTASEVKLAVMRYFRFERKYLCASEFCEMDVAEHTGVNLIDVEVKVSKQDIRRESKKRKHNVRSGLWLSKNAQYPLMKANFFYMAVPACLVEEAHAWVSKTNEMYGVICIATDFRGLPSVSVVKKGVKLHARDATAMRWRLALRACTENVTMMERLIEADKQREGRDRYEGDRFHEEGDIDRGKEKICECGAGLRDSEDCEHAHKG